MWYRDAIKHKALQALADHREENRRQGLPSFTSRAGLGGAPWFAGRYT